MYFDYYVLPEETKSEETKIFLFSVFFYRALTIIIL